MWCRDVNTLNYTFDKTFFIATEVSELRWARASSASILLITSFMLQRRGLRFSPSSAASEEPEDEEGDFDDDEPEDDHLKGSSDFLKKFSERDNEDGDEDDDDEDGERLVSLLLRSSLF
jgi:hypothetical protein